MQHVVPLFCNIKKPSSHCRSKSISQIPQTNINKRTNILFSPYPHITSFSFFIVELPTLFLSRIPQLFSRLKLSHAILPSICTDEYDSVLSTVLWFGFSIFLLYLKYLYMLVKTLTLRLDGIFYIMK